MAPTVKSPSVVLPPPSYSYEPFFSPIETSKTFFETSAPSSPLCQMERSIRQVMSKYGAGDLHGSALLPSYRCLRRRRPQEENQAVAVTHDDNTYKIMVDVRDFAEGSVTVRALGENELVVEGIIQKKEESSPSENFKSVKSCSKNFQQRFMFPGLQVEGVTSSVSSDGILTVTAPRKPSEDKAIEFQMPVTQAAIDNSGSTSESSQISAEQTTKVTSQQSQATSQTALQADTASIKSSEHIVPIQVEGGLVINEGGQVADNYTKQSMLANQQKASQESSIRREESVQTSSQVLSQTGESKREASKELCSTQTTGVKNVPISTQSLSQVANKSIFDDFMKQSLVPIDNKGLFFQDTFFEKSRRYFQDAVDQVMKRSSSDLTTTTNDPLSWYNNHRSTSLLEDTRAGTIKTEEKDYKIVLDVRDFEAGSVNVRAVGDNEILVEGKMERKTEGSSISRRFTRRFVMPGLVKCEMITSALSSDGVLTITAPKKESGFKIVELTGDDMNMSKRALTNSSVFGSSTPTPIVSIPPSNVTSPTSDMGRPFEPVFSKGRETVSSSNISQQNSSQITSEASTTQSCATQSVQESSNSVNAQRETIVPTALDQSVSTNKGEKIVNINYIDKNQAEIDSLQEKQQQQQQYQLIGAVKDLSDMNLKETVKQRKSSQQTQTTRDIAIKCDDPSGLAFPIVRRGPFYQDSFFNEVQQNFQSAIRQVLDRWVDVPSLLFSDRGSSSLCNFDRFDNTLSNYRSILDCDSFDDLTCYKTLRHRSLKEENQAATVKENTDDFKIVLDVHGFTENDLSIRATSHNELIVEGKMANSSGTTSTSHSFKKQFLLPGQVRMEAVHSALSADDILTITVPKNTLLRITDKSSF